MTVQAKHQVLIIGGGTAGITVTARLLRKGFTDVAVIEPSDKHYYQPMWTLVGGGQASAVSTERPESSVMPKAATWIRKAAAAVDRRHDDGVVLAAECHRGGVLRLLPLIELHLVEINLVDVLGGLIVLDVDLDLRTAGVHR